MSPSKSNESPSISNLSQSTSTANVVIENNVGSEESLPSSNQVSLTEQKPLKRKVTRQHWPDSVKEAARRELADCIKDISNLTEERGTAFMKRYNLVGRTYRNFRHIIYNMGRKTKN